MTSNFDILSKRASLSPEQRALLEKRMKGLGKSAVRAEEDRIPRRSDRGTAPLSFAQQRLWFLDLLEPGNTAYNLPNAVRMQGNLNIEVLERSLNEVIKRHEAMRITVAMVDGEPVQVIAPNFNLSLPIWSIEANGESELEERILEVALEEAERPFSLTEGPLVRAALLQAADDDHVLLLTKHHLISDGWSMAVLIQEMMAIYQAFAAGQPSSLPELSIQYGDFAAWQRQWLQGEVLEKQISYWKSQLGQNLPILQLPTDRPRPDVMKIKGAVYRFVLPAHLMSGLTELSQREGVTLYMMMLAAFKVLMHRYTDQEEVLVGSPIANRKRNELEGMIGFFVNTLVLRSNLAGDPTFRALLQQVRQVTVDSFEHQDVPFEKLVEELQPERNRSYSPLFQVMFVLQNYQKSVMELPGLTLSQIDIDRGTTVQFDLTLDLEEMPEGLVGKFKYNALLFDEQTVERMAAHYLTLLEAVTADPEQTLSDLRARLDASDIALFEQMNDTAADYDLDALLLDVFTEQAEQHPERVALICGDQTMTYGELHARSNQVAHFLRQQGVQRNQLVGILMERGFEMMVGLYGIIKSGAAYVPIDPEYPAQRVRYMLADSGAPVLLTKQVYLGQVREIIADLEDLSTLLLLDPPVWGTADRPEGKQMFRLQELNLPLTTPVPVNEPDDVAYMIYTSGSTGNPKGVKVSHQAIINRLLWHQDTFEATPDDVIAQRTSVCFDVSVWELFWALRHGGRLSILPTDVVKDPYRMHEQLVRDRVTVMHFVPSLFSLFVSSLQNVEPQKRPVPSLRWVITSGEALPDKPVQLWFEMFTDGAKIANLYGPTEAAIDVTSYIIDRKPERSILIGKPIANTQLYVLDPQGRQCPVLVKGELYIGGVQLAEGYHNKPDKTAEAFLPNHLPHAPGTRLYRTGDLARVLPDGNIEYLGRKDSQVKVRGYRIELGEIENTLIQHPHVEHAAVLVRKGPDGNNMLIAYVMSNKNDLEIGELKRFLGAKMPEYMVPPIFYPLAFMPLSPNGKVDRKALAELKVTSATQESRTYTAPVDQVQAKIATIWSDVLQREDIGIHDNFFDIGGHSLLVVKLYDALKREFAIDFPMVDLFQYTTVKAIADAVAKPAEEETAVQPTGATGRQEDSDIAIIGIGLRFPQANTPYEFWQNLREGRESITAFSEAEQEPFIFNQDPVLSKKLVRAGAFLEGIDKFDAEFFQMSEREAALLDPQQRLFLMCVWEAIEDAGYNIDDIREPVSLYAGASTNQYLPLQAFGMTMADMYQSFLASQPSFMATRVSYKLNLTGESMMVNTACSTSLVAVHMACQNLLNGLSDYAIAGGVSIQVPQKTGYLYEENFILSPDGHCRAFDKDASGTVTGNGVGAIFLKRLADAKRDGDPVYAVIKGTATNNDGNQKIGYTAPSVQGQVKVIAQAQAVAGVKPESISYIESHGTGTKLGDPIEVSALTQVFRKQTDRKQYCALGSVKTNIGHLDTAAGIAGLIKTALALKHAEIPPSLHYREANPAIDFANSPFFVNTKLQPWVTDGGPRRAGVSSFGIGGTNAHVILEEAPVDGE